MDDYRRDEKQPHPAMVENADVGQVHPAEEKRVLRKLDMLLMPLLWCMFFIAYLDRGAIGNARLMGIQEDLGLSNRQYYECLFIFFVGNVVVALPIALGIRKVPARFVFGPTVSLFGVAAMLMVVAGGFGGVMALRFLIGCGEGVLTMGFLYLGQWYKAEELALRYGTMYWAAPVAGFSSGLIAYAIQMNLDFEDGLQSWKWLFLVEGVPAGALGVIMALLLPSLPDRVAQTGHFLFPSQQEKDALIARTTAAQNVVDATFRPRQIRIAFIDHKTWFMAFLQATPTLSISAFAVLLPTIIQALGFSDLTANLYTIIPYTFAVVMLPFGCWISDRYQSRAIPYLAGCVTTLIGFVILLATPNKTASMAGLCFVAAGSYPNLCISIAWNNTTHGGWTKRCTAFAITQFTIQGFGVMATQIYRDPPRFYLGHGILLGIYFLAFFVCGFMYYWQRKANRSRNLAAEKRRVGELPPLGDIGTFEDLCDFHPDYRYVY